MPKQDSRNMEKWEDLKIYKNLPPEEIPTRFKEFARFICEKLKPHGFRLKESKTEKRLFRFNGNFEQSIYFDNSSRLKNQKDVRIYVYIKPLFTDNPLFYRSIFQGFEVNPDFTMSYPLTKEYMLLADHLAERIEKHVLPFFDKYSTFDKVVSQYQQLLSHYKNPYDGSISMNWVAVRLIYDCAFRVRNKEIFTTCHLKYLQEEQKNYEQCKNDPRLGQLYLDGIEKLHLTKRLFDDDDLHKQEVERQNERAFVYVSSFDKKKHSR